VSGWGKLIGYNHHRKIDSFPWEAPVWKDKFKHVELNLKVENKELLIIHNKYTDEWGKPPINFISIEAMMKLYSLLSDKFTVIIIHPTSNAKGLFGG